MAEATAALNNPDMKLSEDEAQLYDRQIRLWGLEAQKQLHVTRVLIAGLRGLGAEVAKNLVLAGVKAVTLCDSQPLALEDCDANFLAPRSKVGTNRAEASIDRLQNLNPMVQVRAETTSILDHSEEFFKNKFDLVLASSGGMSTDDLVHLNNICRQNKIKFFCGDIHGFFGYSFMDLLDHEYVEEVVKKIESDANENGTEPAAKKLKTDDPCETTMVKHSDTFVSLEDSLKVDWSEDKFKRRVKRMDPSFFLVHILLEFHSREGRSPQKDFEEMDLKLLSQLRDSISEKFSLPEGKIPNELLPLLFAELSPVAAIIGGVLAQEMIKVITKKDAPHKNFFLYNPLQSAGVVEAVGC